MKDIIRGRFNREMDEEALEYTSSLTFDRHLFYYDLLVDYAHVLGLVKEGHISDNDAKIILNGLMRVEQEGIPEGNYEDIHVAIESKLIDEVGEDIGGKLHTGRSRNDEVATCLRMLARDLLLELMVKLNNLREIILKKAEENIGTIMPGFTHLQPAQPTSLAHWLLAYHDPLERDFQRAREIFQRVNLSPLGCGAFASTGFILDREFTAELLGFNGIVEHSMDGVAGRDFLLECVYLASSVMVVLSRMAEELIIWSSFPGFVELPDEFASTSSIMPQKKNPDVAELVRAKTGSVMGHLMALMSIYKALPFSYNRDLQEMNIHMYGALKMACDSVGVMAKMFEGVKFNIDAFRSKSVDGFTTATALADTIVKVCGIPFRRAHRIVARAAMEATQPSLKLLDDISSELMGKKLSSLGLSPEHVESSLDPEKVVESRITAGGTSTSEVKKMIVSRKKRLERDRKKVFLMRDEISTKLERLKNMVAGVVHAG